MLNDLVDGSTLRSRVGAGMRTLCQWASEARGRPLPEDVRRRAALILADDIAAMVAASGETQVARAQAALVQYSGRGQATVFAPGAPLLDRNNAATANGMAATWCELDEGYRKAPCHAGAYILPALLAEAEATGVSTGDVLTALAIAYDITTRLAQAFPFPGNTVHPHAAFATIGAAAGVSLLRRHDPVTLLGAVTGAASMASAGPFRHAMDGAMVRNAWTAVGAWTGLQSADWAEIGITGIAETPYDTFATSFATGLIVEALDTELGVHWNVLDGYHKMFACCQYAHSAIEATLALNKQADPGTLTSLTSIQVETHPRGMALDTKQPATTLAAKFSMQHAVAAATLLGTGGQASFSEASLNDPAIAQLRDRVRMVPHPQIGVPPLDRPARVTWLFADGHRLEATCESAQGGADRPFAEVVLRQKIITITGAVFPAMPAGLMALIDDAPGWRSRPWAAVAASMTGRLG